MYDWAEFRHFRYLLAILEKQGFRAAAEILHTAQPNLSVQARQFQENAAVQLFRRTRNGRILPTEAGIAFMALARFLLETREEVIDALIAIERGTIGRARFGCSPIVDPALFRTLCSIHKQLLPCSAIRPTHGDSDQLAEEVANGAVDAALVTLPVKHPDLIIEDVCRNRLVVCLRKDHVLAAKAILQPADLDRKLTVLYDPHRHTDAHKKLLDLLSEVGLQVEDYSRASHPSELQMLVREGHGLTLIREGTALDDALTTRRIAGVDWTVDTPTQSQSTSVPPPPLVLDDHLAKSDPITKPDAGEIGDHKPEPRDAAISKYDFDTYSGKLYRVFEGSVFEGVVTNHVDGGLSGPILLMLTTDYYSHDHQQILLPQGTRLVGSVQAVNTSQARKMVVSFHRAICPDGFSIDLDKFAGLDPLGTTGLATKVDNRYLQTFAVAAAIGGLGGLAQVGNNNVLDPSAQIRNGISSQSSEEAEEILNHFLNRLPIITLKEGSRARVYIGRDLLISSYADHRVEPAM